MSGAAASVPVRPGLPSPSAFPTQTPTAYSALTPTDHASRKPKLVPVFQAMGLELLKCCQPVSSPGRYKSFKTSKVCHNAEALRKELGSTLTSDLTGSSSGITRTGG